MRLQGRQSKYEKECRRQRQREMLGASQPDTHDKDHDEGQLGEEKVYFRL